MPPANSHVNSVNTWISAFSTVTFYNDEKGNLTAIPVDYKFSAPWSGANAQYNYFSNPENGYSDYEVIVLQHSDEVADAISNYNIQKGDLLYWSKDGGKTASHATMINDVTEDDILFTGHTDSAYDKSVKDTMNKNGNTIMIVRLNDNLGGN